jgi:DtxR family transcriptional regulator, Mn-dependent transcriptional regulator
MPSESVEDYLEAIYTVQRTKGYARTTDIKKIMDHSAASVTEMFQKMDRDGYVNYEKYGGVTLTKEGLRIAILVSTRHKILTNFFEILGIPADIAQDDACKIEHNVHSQTMERLTRFVEFVQAGPENPRWLDHFQEFWKTGNVVHCSECEQHLKETENNPSENNHVAKPQSHIHLSE